MDSLKALDPERPIREADIRRDYFCGHHSTGTPDGIGRGGSPSPSPCLRLRNQSPACGLGFDEFRWPRPVRPGDELHIESEVLEVRPSRSRSNQELIKVRTTTLNQNDEAVQVQIANLIVPRRQSADVG